MPTFNACNFIIYWGKMCLESEGSSWQHHTAGMHKKLDLSIIRLLNKNTYADDDIDDQEYLSPISSHWNLWYLIKALLYVWVHYN